MREQGARDSLAVRVLGRHVLLERVQDDAHLHAELEQEPVLGAEVLVQRRLLAVDVLDVRDLGGAAQK